MKENLVLKITAKIPGLHEANCMIILAGFPPIKMNQTMEWDSGYCAFNTASWFVN
jgi:hypothetical protein